MRLALAGSNIEVRIATASDDLDGDDPDNIVNRITAGGHNGVQLEQSEEARDGFWNRGRLEHGLSSAPSERPGRLRHWDQSEPGRQDPTE